MQSVDPVTDFLGHAADVAADHRATMVERLLDHQRGVLPPNRWHHDPVDGLHQLAKLVACVCALDGHVGKRFDGCAHKVPELTRLELEVRAVHGETRLAVGRRGAVAVA